jgi:hypothetical protein
MTIAYSNKFKSWTSKYSFEPTCYASIGEEMISFDDDGETWIHDTNSEMCNFYGTPGGSQLEVSSNQDPSAIKAFKSVSIETNGEGWSGQVFTNDEYEGNEKQEGEIKNSFFKNKEGFKYAEMPRSKINSSVFVPAGKLGSLLGPASAATDYGPLLTELFLSILNNYFFSSPGAVIASFSTQLAVSEIEFDLPGSFMADFIQPNTNVSYIDGEGNTETLDRIKFVRASKDKVTLSCKVTPNLEGEEVTGGFDFFSDTENILPVELTEYLGENLYEFEIIEADTLMTTNKSLFSIQDSEINGDQMRGPYARLRLTTDTTKPFELHAINVDYQFSKLDSRLNQNS